MRWQHHDDNYDYFSGMRINRQNLIHLRFADDIILIANNSMTAILMIQELVQMYGKVGLQMNNNKMKVMSNGFSSKVTNNKRTIRIEYVNVYFYFGKRVNQNNELDQNFTKDAEQ
uniref:Reverse transcriptase domain-containing protein n=1 Tax=Caenorhabditis japonica TaxID=281687 RepID=A0A8R1IGU0_CAEJA